MEQLRKRGFISAAVTLLLLHPFGEAFSQQLAQRQAERTDQEYELLKLTAENQGGEFGKAEACGMGNPDLRKSYADLLSVYELSQEEKNHLLVWFDRNAVTTFQQFKDLSKMGADMCKTYEESAKEMQGLMISTNTTLRQSTASIRESQRISDETQKRIDKFLKELDEKKLK